MAQCKYRNRIEQDDCKQKKIGVCGLCEHEILDTCTCPIVFKILGWIGVTRMQIEMKASLKHNNSITPHSLPLLRSVGARGAL